MGGSKNRRKVNDFFKCGSDKKEKEHKTENRINFKSEL